jgi:hypothetical protein
MNRLVKIMEGGIISDIGGIALESSYGGVTCPYGMIKVGEVAGSDICSLSCAAFNLSEPSEKRQYIKCLAGKFTIGYIEMPKDV